VQLHGAVSTLKLGLMPEFSELLTSFENDCAQLEFRPIIFHSGLPGGQPADAATMASMVAVHRFTLLYALRLDTAEEGFMARLFEAGCNDALVGLGRPAFAALEFERGAADRDSAVRDALEAVAVAWPAAALVEIQFRR